jgi:hypothetical protein
MKYLFVIAVLTGIVLQSSSSLVILARFELNKEYIAKNLCVKRKIKNNCCKGSCVLKKELQEAAKKEHDPSTPEKGKAGFELISQSASTVKITSPLTALLLSSDYFLFIPASNAGSVFHPPPALVS